MPASNLPLQLSSFIGREREIAAQLAISPRTVNAHLRSIFNKLDVPTRTAAVRYALEHKLV